MTSPLSSLAQAWAQVRAAQGRSPADLVVKNCRIVNVYSAEIHAGDIAVKDGLIVAIRENFDGGALRSIDAQGRFATPGLVASFTEPGLKGWPGIADLASGLLQGVTCMIQDLTSGPSDSPGPLPQRQWAAKRCGVPESLRSLTPVCRRPGELIACLRSGLAAFPVVSREDPMGVGEMLKSLRAAKIDTARVCLGRWLPETGMNSLIDALRVAQGIGLAPAEAFAMATLNPAILYGLDHRIGSISPGRCADFSLREDLATLKNTATFLGGIELKSPDDASAGCN